MDPDGTRPLPEPMLSWDYGDYWHSPSAILQEMQTVVMGKYIHSSETTIVITFYALYSVKPRW